MLTDKQRAKIMSVIQMEGLDYGFMSYSSFPQIKDPEFRSLLAAWQEARANFLSYLEDNGIDENGEDMNEDEDYDEDEDEDDYEDEDEEYEDDDEEEDEEDE